MNLKYMAAVLIFLIDQLVKSWIRSMPNGHVFYRCPPLFEFISSTNTGAAFSLFSGNPLLLAAVSVLILGFLLVYFRKTMNLTLCAQYALACLLGGALGNLWDRVFLGGVTDYIRILLFRFPVFNLADIAITLSVAVLLMMTVTNRLEVCTGENNGRKTESHR